MRTKSGISRRGFIAQAAIGAAAASLGSPASLSAISRYPEFDASPGPNPLRLNRNESPYGLAPAAAEALKSAVDPKSSRYPIEEPKVLIEAIAKRFGVENDNVILGYGSTEILKMATESFCNSARGALVAEPTFEAVVGYCPFIHARAQKVKLTSQHKHDLPKMLLASPSAGMIFYCNPSNPAGTYINKEESERFVRRLPRRTVLLADEAYAEYVTAPDYESCVRFVKEGLPVVVSRTFSKIYGMAGLRAGFAIARKDLLARMTPWSAGAMPATAMAAAHAALGETELIAARKRGNADRRADLMRFFDAHGFRYTPSVANHLMVDARMPTPAAIEELKRRNVYVGRPWPVWPTHVRVSIGSTEDMERFKSAFLGVVKTG